MHYNLDIILFQIISGQFRSVLFSFGQFWLVWMNKPTLFLVLDFKNFLRFVLA